MSAEHVAEVFRRWGYLQAQLDDFERIPPFSHADLDAAKGKDADKWRKIYCSTIGAEFAHMPFPDRVKWVADRMEQPGAVADREYIFRRILAAETFENFIHTRYVGTKRFSIEGTAALIPLLDSIIQRAGEHGFEKVLIAMAHRGRLNVIVQTVGVDPSAVFANFEDVDPMSVLGSGDVKYHRGATGTFKTRSGKDVKIHLASNPSHLEAVNPVIMGRTKAHQIRIGDERGEKILCVVIHGDAAFAGQGIAAETLNYATLRGFNVGGTIQIIANNLIGFTAVPASLHSSRYSSDIAKRLSIPIFHVNGEDPDAVWRVGEMAMDYRKEFLSDVVVDLIGYRKYGHSEVDDPTLTSPRLYEKIAKRPYLYKSYAKQLKLSDDKIQSAEDEYTNTLNSELERGRAMTKQPVMAVLPDYWKDYRGGAYDPSLEVETSVPEERLAQIAKLVSSARDGFTIHPKLEKGMEQRYEMGVGKRPIDFGAAESFAFGSLLWENTPVRLVGQDCRRGTFNHRHAVFYDHKTGEEYVPLANLHAKQARFDVYDSMLSEAAAVGYEYGYARDYPEALVCWEAQFGDFANGAQIIIDQFIAAGEEKWGLLSGITLLLPHGFEGQGPEHSSARLERYIQLCGEDNMQVCQPTTAAQYFHLLRRQALRRWRKPLIVMTPKSMLRAPAACSQLSELTSGQFMTMIPDSEVKNAERLLICSGKIAHELMAERRRQEDRKTAIIRIEQLFPFPEAELAAELERHPNVKSVVWVQEEPANMGALFFVRPILERLVPGGQVSTVRRTASGTPATGSAAAHNMEQQALLKLAFASYE